MHTNMLDNKGTPLSITFVYGHLILAKREEVWCKFKELKLLSHLNWLCIGDFNKVLNTEDKFSFTQRSILGAESLQNLISDLALYDLAASG